MPARHLTVAVAAGLWRGRRAHSSMPVLVTGIRPDRVLGLECRFRAADAVLPDLCDKA
ncbi:hypothetical protein EMEDMD4_260019 [Sinorhizobium medicae]|uniref:Uncharacterized protein n=1 Tax=Sinorhizobium medicae TaxID=110321 RepID=A0A508WWQ1_9HYPH|nr:hypothetical protein EMEDMD4_260019 [Sinorhizobium medicae]